MVGKFVVRAMAEVGNAKVKHSDFTLGSKAKEGHRRPPFSLAYTRLTVACWLERRRYSLAVSGQTQLLLP